jgi:phosphatidylglycerol:prolipoprotein diacylglycerol transferase
VLADAAGLFAVIGQPIGRIGNIINGDILGAPSTLPWATAYTNPNAILQRGFSLCDPNAFECTAYQPAAAYEAIGTILIGLVLLLLLRRRVRDGVLVITYVALYAVSQLVIFQWRESEPVIGLGLKQAQMTAIVVLAVGVPLLLALRRRYPGTGAAVAVTADPEPAPGPQQPAEPVA